MQNTFAVVSCNDDAGTAPYATRPISRNLVPHWDETAEFKDVAPSDRLRVSVLDRRLVGPHLLLGQVSFTVLLEQATCFLLQSWLHLQCATPMQHVPVSSGSRARLGAPHEVNTCVNQVEIGVHEFADGRPHYAWLPLAGRAAAGSMGGEVRCL